MTSTSTPPRLHAGAAAALGRTTTSAARRVVGPLTLVAGLALALPPSVACSPQAAGSDQAAPKTSASAAAKAADGSARVAARVGGETITEQELDQSVANRLLTLRSEEYQIRREALQALIDGRLIAAEAKRRNVSAEELTRVEIDQKTPAVTPAEISQVFESAKDRLGGMLEADARKTTNDALTERRRGQRRAAFVKEISGRTDVKILLSPPRADVPTADGPVRGAANAPITIIEFTDFQCGFCARANVTMKQLLQKYPTQVRHVVRNFPLPNHREAPKAAEAAHCAGEQGKYWEAHDAIFANQRDVSEPALLRHAQTLGLDQAKFSACLSSGKHAARIKRDLAEGESFGVTGTPGFFINGRFVNGALPLEMFVQIIEEELQFAAAR